MDSLTNPFKVTIDRQVIKLLGAHLYGDTPSVINELIANAYDARAKRVWITLITEAPFKIIIQDDGIGMTVDEINDYYLNIGYNRREETELQQSLSLLDESKREKREDMGQKGIGKLAVFALSKKVTLISYKNYSNIGCSMDFDVLCTKDGLPQPLTEAQYPVKIKSEQLSENGSGTIIILENVVKDLSKAHKFIASSIARSFILNNENMDVYIRKNDEDFKIIVRNEFKYFDDMDVIATIGSSYNDEINQVKNNRIPKEYKRIIQYEELVNETKDLSPSKKFDSLPITLKVFDKLRTSQIDFSFAFHGWIGTVKDTNSFKTILEKDGYTEDEVKDKELIIVDDNRISIYSRGKIGEYNMLPKLKTRVAYDAYVIGEIFVDAFEDNNCIDMATSNRRGYQEDDIRYETLCKNLKLLVSRVVNAKQAVNKKEAEDKNQKEADEIKKQFETGIIKSKEVFNSLNTTAQLAIEEDYKQFTRAVASSYKDKNMKHLLISHRQDDLREYGDFIIAVLLRINRDLKERIVFTSNPNYGLKKGENIFDELKKCFRPNYFIIFLFSKSFYDSNPCLAEAGAAWATNTQYINIVVDIGFNDIDKPINNAIAGAPFNLNSKDQIDEFALTLQCVLDNIDSFYEKDNIVEAINDELQSKKYTFKLPQYHPKRKFQIYPLCPICGRTVKPKINYANEYVYECQCSENKTLKGIIE